MRRVLLFAALAASVMGTAVAAGPAYFGAWGSKSGKTYHTRIECKASQRIKPQNKIEFMGEADAKSKGRTLCQQCTKLTDAPTNPHH